jgi:ABC-type sugar transport system ATPase subunit
MARITLDRLAHSYKANPQDAEDYALKEINHVWQQGGAYALLGPSGCGKTTLLNIISGLVVPTRGRILFDDRDVTQTPTETRNIAQVFQFPVVYDTMTVREDLASRRESRRSPAFSTSRGCLIERRATSPPMQSRRSRSAGVWYGRTWPQSCSTSRSLSSTRISNGSCVPP